MGCDIHLVLETADCAADGTQGPWTFCHDYPYIPARALRWSEDVIPANGYISWAVRARDYEFFAALAGVRGEGPAPKGLPADISPRTVELVSSWGSDAHHATWYYAEEFAAIYGQLDRVRARYVADKMRGDLKRSDGSEVSYDDWLMEVIGTDVYDKHRVIIWFDN